MAIKVGDFVERKRSLEPPAVAWRDDPWERGEVESLAVGRVRIKADGDSVWRRADDFAVVERPAVPFGAHGGESREVRDARDRWAWFTDAELLALRGVVMRGESEWAPNPVQAALYREVCAAIDARPSCVLAKGGAS